MRHHKNKWAAIAVAGVVSVAALSGCGAKGAGSSAGGPINIGVGVDAAYAPFFLADHEGLFKKAGLDVKLVQFSKGGEAVQGIAGKQVQMAGNSDTTTITLLAQNPDLRVLAIYEQAGRYLKVVARPGVTEASQIKKIGVVAGLSDYMARKYFEKAGIDTSSVKFVEGDPPEMPALAKKGTIDAYLLWEPWPAQGEKLGLKVLTDTGSYGYSYVHWLLTDSSWLKTHEKEAGTVAQVLAEATKEIDAEPDKAAEAVHDEAKIPVEDAKTAIDQIDWGVRAFEAKDMSSYKEQVDYFIDKGILKKSPDLKSAVLTDWFTSHATSSKGAS